MEIPDFAGWSNEEVGAFIKGLGYIDDGGDLRDLLEADAKRSPLSENPEEIEDIPGFGQRRLDKRETAEVYTKMADYHFKRLFGSKAQPIIAQIATDAKPWIDLILSGELEDEDVADALHKLVLLCACDGALALEHRPGRKKK